MEMISCRVTVKIQIATAVQIAQAVRHLLAAPAVLHLQQIKIAAFAAITALAQTAPPALRTPHQP